MITMYLSISWCDTDRKEHRYIWFTWTMREFPSEFFTIRRKVLKSMIFLCKRIWENFTLLQSIMTHERLIGIFRLHWDSVQNMRLFKSNRVSLEDRFLCPQPRGFTGAFVIKPSICMFNSWREFDRLGCFRSKLVCIPPIKIERTLPQVKGQVMERYEIPRRCYLLQCPWN